MINNKQKAEKAAIQRAAEQLQSVDLQRRCEQMGLPPPDADGRIAMELFGRMLLLRLTDCEAVFADNGTAPKPADLLLALHYLLCENPLRLSGDWVTFRDFPGGQFYWEPFLSRSIKPLVKRTGNDLTGLRQRLDQRFRWCPAEAGGDFSARVHAVGKLEAVLVYHLGDDEFPPDATILFDSAMRHVYVAEDAAVLAGRICLGLL